MAEAGAKGAATTGMSVMDLLTKLAGLVALIYAYLFFAGWIYFTSYLSWFHLDLWALDVPIYDFPAASVIALQSILVEITWALTFITLGCMLVSAVRTSPLPARRHVSWMQGQIDRCGEELRRIRDLLAVPRMLAPTYVALVAFAVTLVVADGQGAKAARKTWNTRTHVRLVFKLGDKQVFDPALLKANDSDRLSLLTQTKDLVIVFEPDHQGASNENVFVLTRTDLASVRTWTEGRTPR